VLLSPSSDRPELLGGQAAVVWEVLDDLATAAAIAQRARALIPEVDDLGEAIEELCRLGLVDERP
jgi:hypothetical protein